MNNIGELKTGYNTHRLNENDPYHKKEINFVKVINKELKHNGDFFKQIVGKNRYKDSLDRWQNEYLTEEEEKVALSVIQWLGTPVGQNFIKTVDELDEIKK